MYGPDYSMPIPKIPGSLPSQLLLYIILHPRLFDASVTNLTLHQSNIPEFDVATVQLTPCQYHNSWINAVPTFPTHYPLHPKILDAAVTRPMLMPVKFPQLDLESRLRLVHAC